MSEQNTNILLSLKQRNQLDSYLNYKNNNTTDYTTVNFQPKLEIKSSTLIDNKNKTNIKSFKMLKQLRDYINLNN
jgi:hypothetical protein